MDEEENGIKALHYIFERLTGTSFGAGSFPTSFEEAKEQIKNGTFFETINKFASTKPEFAEEFELMLMLTKSAFLYNARQGFKKESFKDVQNPEDIKDKIKSFL